MSNLDVAKLLIVDEGTEIVPKCCWCGSNLVFKDEPKANGRPISWCSGSKACRQRQMENGISVKREGKRRWLFVPTPKQCEVMEARERNVFACGNRGGGKSVAARWLCHQLAIAIPGFRYAILRTSFPELNITHLSFLEHEMNELGGEAHGFKYHKTDHICYYPKGSMGIYAQCATDADVKKILGAEVALVVFDEAPTFQWDHMRLIASSVRVPVGSGLVPMVRYLGNPVGPSIDELWQYFVDQDVDVTKDQSFRPANWRFIEIHIQDNPYLDAKTYWEDMSSLPSHILQAWRDGKRVDANSMFQIIEFHPETKQPYHVIRELPKIGDDGTSKNILRQPWVRIYRSYDHGYDRDPAICLWFAVLGRRIILFHEQIWKRVTAKDIAKEIKDEEVKLLGKNHGRPIMTYCDPVIDIKEGNEKTIKYIFESNRVAMTCATNNRKQYSHSIHSALKEVIDDGGPRLQILAGHDVFTGALGAPYTLKYLPRMTYDEDDPLKMADHKHDHGPVALAYFLMKHIPVTVKQNDAPKYPEWWTQYFIAGTNIPRDRKLRQRR